MQCPRCQGENPAGVKFCGECGARLESLCLVCRAANPPTNKFCHQCGEPLAGGPPAVRFASPQVYTPKHLAEKILNSKSALEGERKQVTVLFADLKGSMELLADRDPEEARTLLDPVLERMMEAVHRYEGTVNQVMGDGIMALFGAPLAHEDHAVRACYAALRMQDSVKRYAGEIRRSHGVTVEIRVGLNSGEVVVRAIGSDLHMDYTAVGQTTHLAARVEQLASPGTILLTAETLKLAEGYVEVMPLGPVPVKGLAEPVEMYEVTGAGAVRSRLQASATRGLTKFVGRGAEIAQLTQALDRARSGHGQVVGVVGEPGVGKSRLFWEFARSHRTQGWLILESGSASYGKATPYLPVVDLLKAYFKIEDRDHHREIREKVTGKVLTLDETLKSMLPAFLTLLDVSVEDSQWQALDPAQRRHRTLEAVKRLLLRESQLHPLLLMFEDLHWIDSETQAVLDSLIESLPTARLLLLVNYRSDYQHGWGSKTYYTQLRLDPLPPENAEELLEALLGTDAGLRPLKQLLIERTQGNPFFLEESVWTLIETKVLVGDRGAYRLAKDLPSVQVPATVQAVLAARIDRLPPEEKHLLQSASVIGENVPFNLLQAVVGTPEDEFRRSLSRLQAVEFLYEASLFPELEYTFKHGLTYQVAYNSLLVERRRALHARIAEAIEALYPDRLAELVDRLAHHAFRGEVWPKAVAYLRQAGAKAVARSAYREAIDFFEQALSAITHLAESRETLTEALDIRIALGPALMAIKGSGAPEAEASYIRARELCSRIEDTSRLFPVLWGLWYVNYGRGELQTARKLGEQLLSVAQGGHDSALLLEAHHTLWPTLFAMGELASANSHLQQGLALYDPQQHRSYVSFYGGHDPGVCCRNHSALTLWALGYPDQALEWTQEALSLARELSHPLTTVITLYYAALVHYQRGEREATEEKAKALVALATAQGLPVWMEHGSRLLAGLLVEQGRGKEGIAQLERGLTTGSAALLWREVLYLCLLAAAYAEVRQPEKGLRILSEAMAKKAVEGLYEPEVHRLTGELLLTQAASAPQEAEGCFRRAVEIARGHQAKSLELRAVTGLSRLLHRQGKREEARQVLAETYGWFKEGFDTADLKEANRLLQELSVK